MENIVAAQFARTPWRVLLVLVACAAGGCVSGPPLPKRAALETAGAPALPTDFAAIVAGADIIYFPVERAASAGRSEPAALLLEAFQNSGGPVAIGWDLIDGTQQPLLDEIAAAPARAREQLVSRLELAGNGRAREHCRAVLRQTGAPGVRHLALRLPESVSEKLRIGAVLTPEEQLLVTTRFNPPAAGLEKFATQMTAAESLSGRDVAAAYRARAAAQQFAAGQIVRHFEGGGGGKLLVFVHAADVESGTGIPFYVAQKLQLRQLVLGPSTQRNDAAKLLTRAHGHGRGRLDVVDGTPGSVRD